MEKNLLIGINSQYIHTNLAIRYLKSFAEANSDKKIEIYESNINNQIHSVVTDIFLKKPDRVIFSVYIWNKEFIFSVVRELKKILPNLEIVLGGPEVTYNPEETLRENKDVDYILVGEGERVFLNFLTKEKTEIKGVGYLKNDKYHFLGEEDLIENLEIIPFPYTDEEINDNTKIVYYESSRGCPFSCSYCLSSVDRCVRYWAIDRVKEDLLKFLNSKIKLVKFVDRTFNLRKDRYLEIWQFLLENYREGIVFHFEINANVFDDETIEFLKKVPKNYFQFEIGVQSINKETMESINRRNLLERLEKNIKSISKNIHLHVDLIAGLPYDTYEKFQDSFNYVHELGAEMIQLGFLKILKGTKISSEIEKYSYKYMDLPPYEVLENKFITFEEIIKLKNVEKMLDYFYNSEKFKNSVRYTIENNYETPYKFYEEISEYFKEKGYLGIGHKLVNIFNIFMEFYKEKRFKNLEIFTEFLKLDYLYIGKPGVYPSWFVSKKDKEEYNEILKKMDFKSIREANKNTELEEFEYNIFENKKEKIKVLFTYEKNGVKTEIF